MDNKAKKRLLEEVVENVGDKELKDIAAAGDMNVEVTQMTMSVFASVSAIVASCNQKTCVTKWK